MNSVIKNILIWFVVFLALGAILSGYNVASKKPEKIDVGTLVTRITKGEVKKITVSGDKLVATMTNGSEAEALKEPGQPLNELLKNYGVPPEKLLGVEIEVASRSGAYWASVLLPSLGSFLLLIFVLYFLFRQVSGMNTRAMTFGQASVREQPKNGKHKITFKDVAGVKEAKEELREVVEFLKTPKKFAALGAKIPKGVLLMGQPGTGKTLLARAVAGEADVPFFHISGSEFVEMFVGVGAARVRDLFAKAKKAAPCILFIDEIDAVGRQRGLGMGGTHDEREQTLNQILVEMDGFDPNLGVIVLAATNRPDVLDPALLRPGRFDRRVVLDPPDINDREAILKIHSLGKPLDEKIDIRKVAERTPGFTGADLANLFNEAAILAARKNQKKITQDDVLNSIEKVLLGPERKSHLLNEHEREITAHHEAGHALTAHMLPHADPVRKVSIISRGQAAGYTLKLPLEDSRMNSRADFIDDLAVMLGGYAAELETYSDVTTGASNDLKQATTLARKMVMEYGMSDVLGPRAFGAYEDKMMYGMDSQYANVSSKTAEEIDREITRLVTAAKLTAQEIVKREKKHLDKIVKILLTQENIEQEQFESLFTDHPHAEQLKKKPKKARSHS